MMIEDDITERLRRWIRPSTQPVYLRTEHPVLDDIAAAADRIGELETALHSIIDQGNTQAPNGTVQRMGKIAWYALKGHSQ